MPASSSAMRTRIADMESLLFGKSGGHIIRLLAEFRDSIRFGDDSVDTARACLDRVDRRAPACHEHEVRSRPPLADYFGKIPAVLPGAEAEVRDDQLEGRLVLEQRDGLFGRIGYHRVVSALVQNDRGHARELLLVLDDEDANRSSRRREDALGGVSRAR